MTASNDLDVKHHIWTVLGLEFEDDANKSTMIVRALYSLKSSGASL